MSLAHPTPMTLQIYKIVLFTTLCVCLYIAIQYIVKGFVVFCVMYTMRDIYKHKSRLTKIYVQIKNILYWLDIIDKKKQKKAKEKAKDKNTPNNLQICYTPAIE